MPSNVPAVYEESALVEREETPDEARAEGRAEGRQDVSVALLPLAIVAFLVLAFIAAAWTFLAAAG